MLSAQQRLIIFTTMLIAMLESLDSTIVNVSLPAMMTTLNANQEQITWVITSYLVAAALIIPLTGFLNNSIGQKKLLYILVIGFTCASAGCGISTNLWMMIVFRSFQGAFGAALMPLSQTILRQTFAKEQQGKAMAIWGLGVLVAPVLGPTLGGYISEYLNWRWIFYINVPICALGLFLISLLEMKPIVQRQKIDWRSILYMFVGVGSLQMLLDQGNSHDWFESGLIQMLLLTTITGLSLFVYRILRQQNPVIELRLFKNKNFAFATIMLAFYVGGFFEILTLQPIMLETLFNYNTILAGLTISPLGIACAAGMILASRCIQRIPFRILLSFAVLVTFYGAHYLASMSLEAMQHQIMISNIILGFGLGILFVSLSTSAFSTINPALIPQASGLYSYGRMIGTSFGISLFTMFFSRKEQYFWSLYGSNINQFNPQFQHWLAQQHSDIHNPATLARLTHVLQAQANMSAFLNTFQIISLLLLLLIPLIWVMKPARALSQ